MVLGNEDGLVEALYDAALGRLSWEEIGRRVAECMDGKTLMLSTYDPKGAAADVVTTFGLTPEHIEAYGHFARHDIWATGALEQGLLGQALTSSQIVEDRVLLGSYVYNEYLRPQVDVRYLMGSLIPMEDGRFIVLGTHRPHGAKDFGPQDAQRMTRLLPHVQRALEVRQKLRLSEEARQSAHFVLDQLSLGVILMGATGQLLHVNDAGERILRGGDGLVRTPEGLRACSKEDDKRLQQLVGRLRQRSGETRAAGGHLRVRRPSGRQAYAVMVSPVGPSLVAAGKASPAVLIFVSDPGAKMVSDIAVLVGLFDFTPAEARLVLGLASGTPLPEFARQAAVSHNTVRTQLTRALSKADCRSQLELVLLVARALGGIAPMPTGR